MSSCHGCAEPFGFWKRNVRDKNKGDAAMQHVGCPKCGYSYCQKCIRFKINAQTTENEGSTLAVCQKCYLEAQTVNTNKEKAGTGGSGTKELHTKAIEVLESLDNPGKPPITMYPKSKLTSLKRGLSIEDQKIVDRLEELRGGTTKRRMSQPEDEVAVRLAKLKDQSYDPSSSQPKIHISKPETEEDLLARLTSQVHLEKKFNESAVDDIERRLLILKGQDSQKSSVSEGSKDFGTHNEEKTEKEEADEIMQRYMAEAALEGRSKPASDEESAIPINEESEDEDLDYDMRCRICEEKRATIMCDDCDRDIFCARCFQEFHDELGESHRPGRVNFNSTDTGVGFKVGFQ